MRKVTILVFVAVLAIALVPSLAYAAGYDEPVAGQSPHAGWTTTSDQCKQCHAVHKAVGNRLLLRSMDSRYNDCAYCHLDGTGGAGYDVYIGNLNNGHTLGSFVSKEATGGARASRWNANGRIVIPDASTASYNYRGGTKAKAGTTSAYTGFNTVAPVAATPVFSGLRDNGDTTFNCNACHMAHANPSKVITWRFQSYNEAARTRDTSGLYTYYGPDAYKYKGFTGVNTTQDSRIVNTTDLTTKILVRNPNDRSDGATSTFYSYVDAGARTSNSRNSALTQWCADCHNLNVMGPGMINGQVSAYGAAYTEQAGIYSHSTYYNLSGRKREIGLSTADAQKGHAWATNYPTSAGAPSCADCHVGYSDALVAHDAGGGDTEVGVAQNYGDWPHSGSSSSYALLNQLMTRSAPGDALPSTTGITNAGTDASTYDAVGLDGQCRQCHGPDDRDPADIHNDNTEIGLTFAPNAQ